MFWDSQFSLVMIVLLLTLLGQPIQRTPAISLLAQQSSTSLPGWNLGAGLFSQKRRLSEAVYLETDKDGRNAIIYGRSSEGVEWEIDMSGVVTELADAENPFNPPYQKWAREIAKAVGIDFRME